MFNVLIVADRLARDDIAASEPAIEIDIGARHRAEGPVVLRCGFAANRAARPLRRRFARGSWAAWSRRHAVSISARFDQKNVTGKPSLCNIPMISVSGRPTTFVYEPISFTTKPPAIP